MKTENGISLNLSKIRRASSVNYTSSKNFDELERIDKIAFIRLCEEVLGTMRNKIEKEADHVLGPSHGR